MADLDPLADDLRRLLDAERRSEDVPAAARDRVLLRLGGTFGIGATLATGAGATLAPSGAGAKALGHVGRTVRLARAATLFVAGAATGVGGQHAVQHLRAKAAAPVQVAPRRPMPAALPPPVTGPVPPMPEPAGPSEQPVVHSRRPALPAAAPAQADDRLGAERALLEIARAALARGDAEGALGALARHEATFPRGELTEEREGLRVQALVAARRYDEARTRAARFARHYPRSLFSPVVTQALESIP
ncbi:MAG TPA: hypothetical protein VKZ18_07300 [Polyangia bacterium]|nr:hypothetical protein [Polyangia bacterium]